MTRFKASVVLYSLIASVASVSAAEYRGAVHTKGLAVPGVTLTATRDDQKVVTTTDQQGVFVFPNLAPGEWIVSVEMFGFETTSRKVVMAAGAPPDTWELKLLSETELIAQVEAHTQPAQRVETATAKQPPAATQVQPDTQAQPGKPAGTTQTGPPTKATATAEPQTAAAKPAPARSGGLQRRGAGPAAAGGPQQQGGQRGQFRRMDVNQASETPVDSPEGAIRSEEVADLNQSAANSFIVQGSMSSAVGMEQRNDWGPPGGFGPGGFRMGGPGMDGAGGPGGLGGPGGPDGAGGPGGPGGMGGPGAPGGFRGGGGQGGPPGGFGGGGGMRGGGPGGDRRGGPGGDRRGPGDWQGRRDAQSFGNARRNQRSRYNGSASFTLDNSIWDARTYSVTGAEVLKPSFARGRGSIFFGGPLRIPKLINADKRIMFTIDVQYMHTRTGTTSDPVNMPTLLERSGDFSKTTLLGTPVTIYDPQTGLPFPGNIIPASRLNPASIALLKYLPDPNLPFAARNYQTAWSGANHSHNINSRVANIRIGSKARINSSFGYQGSDNISPNLLQFVDTGAGRGMNAGVSLAYNIRKTLINNVSFNFSRSRNLATPFFANLDNVAGDLGIAGTSQNPNNWGPPSLGFTNYSGLSDGNFSLVRNQTATLTESLIWIYRKHNFTFGGDYRRQQFNTVSDSNGRGSYSFNGFATSLVVNGVAQTGTGWDMADFLLGNPSTASIRYGNADKYFRSSGNSIFFNDDWRITARFSLNGGLRWDYTRPVTELFNRLVNLDVAPGYGVITPVQPGQPAPTYGSLPSSLIHPDRNNFSPRIGFALRPFKKDSTVVRGGYGIYYNTSVYNIIAANMAAQPPFAQVLSISGSQSNPLDIRNGFLSAVNTTVNNTFAIDPNYRIGYAQTWQLSVQHNLPRAMLFTAGYLGTKGTRLDQSFLPNSVPPGTPVSSLPHGYTYESSNGNSIYHAAQFQLNRRFRSGVGARASYQFSKSIDNAGTGGRGQGGTPVAQDWLWLSGERGLSSFDSRHNLQLSTQYSTGMGRTGGTLISGWRGTLLKDWTVSGNINARTGMPFTATVGGNRSQVSGTAVSNTVRASATGLPIGADGMLFNTAAFALPPAGSWGTAGRDTIPGPTVFSLDSSLGRVVRFGERRSADFQIQGQNILNHPIITNWGTVVGSSTYGLATAASQMRRITLSLRFRF